MGQIDVRKVMTYPPEVIPYADDINLVAGDNMVFEYTGLAVKPPIVLNLYGVSFARYDGLRFWADVDGVSGVVSMDDLGAVRGLDFTEELKVAARDSIHAFIYTDTAVTAYQLRHTIRIDKPNPLLKLVFGFPLDRRDVELIEKYKLRELLVSQQTVPLDPYVGIQKILTFTKRLAATGTVLRYSPPPGYKAVLLDIAAQRPAVANQAIITLERERQGFNTFELDPYCLAGLEEPLRPYKQQSVYIPCLEEMLVEIRVTAGVHRVRLVVGLGKLTIAEKIKWDIELTPEEVRIAEEQKIYELVEAGLR